MKIYLRILAIFYFIGAVLHILDLFDQRLLFSKMDSTWQMWIIYLTIGDAVAYWGLWRFKKYGEFTFLLIAASQLIVYGFFKNIFGDQTFLILFHTLTLVVYFFLKFKSKFIHTSKG